MAPRRSDTEAADDDAIARAANATNNAMFQHLRLDRWAGVRDALWRVLDPLLDAGARVLVVGAGNADDLPLERIAARAARVDLVDVDVAATGRGVARLSSSELRERVHVLEVDVTDGAADSVLRAARSGRLRPVRVAPPTGELGAGDYDLVLGDMLYTQLLHPGLIALEIARSEQARIMRRYDAPLCEALVRRLHASCAPGGHVVHVHDVACWATDHEQPLTVAEVLADPEGSWPRLLRHDACDPHLALERLRIQPTSSAWWHWPLEPNKGFVVRATVAPAAHERL